MTTERNAVRLLHVIDAALMRDRERNDLSFDDIEDYLRDIHVVLTDVKADEDARAAMNDRLGLLLERLEEKQIAEA